MEQGGSGSSGGRLTVVVVAWLAGAGLLVRVWGLGSYWLSPDEILILHISGASGLAGVWSGLTTQAHPPLHFFPVHYLLELGRGFYFLKSSSLIPGVALIVVFFYLGREVGGEVLGIVMAYLASFGYGATLLSEVIWPYSLLCLCLALAWWSYLAYAADGKRRHAYGYALLMLLSLSLHYSAVIALMAVSGAWFLRMAAQRRPAREFGEYFALHAPAAALGLALYYFHLSRISESRREWVAGYLDLGFARSLPELAHNLSQLGSFLFHPWFAAAAGVFSVVGCWSLWKSRREALAAAGLSVLFGLALSILRLYPMSGSRHSMYLFPFMALLCGSGVQYALAAAGRLLRRGGEGAGARGGLSAAAAGAVILSTLPVMALYGRSDFLREYQQAAVSEFTTGKQVYDNIFTYLNGNARPGDVVLCSGQAGDYLEFSAGPGSARRVEGGLTRVTWQGVSCFYDREPWIISGPEELRRLLDELTRAAPVQADATLWLLNIGYYNNKFKYAADRLFYPYLKQARMVERGAVVIYAIPGRAVEQALAAPTPPAP